MGRLAASGSSTRSRSTVIWRSIQAHAASSRQDGQAKSLGEWIRARIVDLPVALVPDGSIGTDADR